MEIRDCMGWGLYRADTEVVSFERTERLETNFDRRRRAIDGGVSWRLRKE